MFKRVCKTLVLAVLIASPALVFAGGASEAASSPKDAKGTDFPKKAMEFVVGFAAGGGNHLAAENLVTDSQAVFGMPITVTLKPGAGTAVANSYV